MSHAACLWKSSPTSKWNVVQLIPGWQENIHEMLLIEAIKKQITLGLQKGSTNMTIFGRVHECKDYEHYVRKIRLIQPMVITLEEG